MRAVLILFALAHLIPALAGDLVLRTQTSEIRLLDAPCTDADTVSHIRIEFLPQFKAARATAKGVGESAGCWAEVTGNVFLVLSDGSYITLPANRFVDPMT